MYENNHKKRILITGANGFIGKNLIVRLNELNNYNVDTFVRNDCLGFLPDLLAKADVVIHLAGENRPSNDNDFQTVNAGLTSHLCDLIRSEYFATKSKKKIILASSMQAELENAYGRSKIQAEGSVYDLAMDINNSCTVFRFPGVFGKWCKPNYNSVVATFCHNIAHDLPIEISDPSKEISLVYIDEVVEAIIREIESSSTGYITASVNPEYQISLENLANSIYAFAKGRKNLITEKVGLGFQRALYSTFISFLNKNQFSYDLKKNTDPRGDFVEMLKTLDSGQFSYFTAHPGATRGGHYHHTKTEKFLVIQGQARFRFRHILNDESLELFVHGDKPEVVDTIPGWSHDITNTGDEKLIVMLWASENFDHKKPDTIAHEV